MMNVIYVDNDGVLANFDKRAWDILRQDPRVFEATYGSDVFWAALNYDGEFFMKLELMPDAMDLMTGLVDMGFVPWILTGCPSQIPDGHLQKQEWAAKKFGRTQPIITCKSRDKSNFCFPGSKIIDDYPKHMDAWTAKGGIWFHHVNAYDTLEEIRNFNS